MLSPSLGQGATSATTWIKSLGQFFRRRQAIIIPVTVALVSRVIVFVLADLVLRLALAHQRAALPFTGPIAVWQRKDATWYLATAQSGYDYSTVRGSRANFFPLYPLLIHTFEPLVALLRTPDPYALTGMLISVIAFALACVGVYRLACDHFGQSVAIDAVVLLAVFPYSLYYGGVFTESIYLALAVWAFVAIERRHWWTAGALAGLASGTRPPGLLIGVCVVLAYLLDWVRERRPLRANVLALALTPLGALAYMLYCWWRWGNPFAYVVTSRAGWHGGYLQLTGLQYVAHVLRHPISWISTRDVAHILDMIAILLMLGFLALTPLIWRRLGPLYALFTAASVLAPILDFPNVNSLGRYLSVVFPVFIVIAYLLRGRPRLAGWISAVSAALLIYFATYFIAGFGLS